MTIRKNSKGRHILLKNQIATILLSYSLAKHHPGKKYQNYRVFIVHSRSHRVYQHKPPISLIDLWKKRRISPRLTSRRFSNRVFPITNLIKSYYKINPSIRIVRRKTWRKDRWAPNIRVLKQKRDSLWVKLVCNWRKS